ncbi:MAG: PAS domain-containing protein [Luteolibacter sp.]
MKPRIGTKIIGAFVLALLLLGGVGAISFHSTVRMADDAARVRHSQEVVATVEKLTKIIGYDAASHRGYLITGDEAFLEKHEQSIRDENTAIEQLKALESDHLHQQENFAALVRLLEERRELAKNHVEMRNSEGFEAIQKEVTTGKGEKMLNDIYELAQQISDEERAELKTREKGSLVSAAATQKGIIFGSALAFILVGAALWQLSGELLAHRKSELALQANDELLRFAMDAEQTGIWQFNLGDQSAICSPRHHQIFGYETPPARWTYENFLEHVLPEDRDSVNQQLQIAITEKRNWNLECRIKRRDGIVRWIRVCGREFSTQADMPTRMAGVTRDITEHKLTEELTHRNKQFKALILDAIPAEIAVLDRNGEIIAVNEPWLRFGEKNGSPAGTIGVGTNYLDASRKAMREGDAHAREAVSGIEAVLNRSLKEFHLEYPCESPGGKSWFLMHAVAAPEEIGGAIVAHTDITARKRTEFALVESEERLSMALAGADFGTWDRNFLKNEASWSARCKTMHGLPTEAEPPTQETLGTIIHPEDWVRVMRAVVFGTTPERPDFQVDYRTIWPDGTEHWLCKRGRSYFNAEGIRIRSVGTVQDITAQKQTEETLRDFNITLEECVQDRTHHLEITMDRLRAEIAERRRLEGEILRISEREQNRLGQDLHDDLGQQLTGIGILAQVLSMDLSAESHPKAADATQLHVFLTESINVTRNLAKSFYPVELERGGLILALQDLAYRTEMLAKISCFVAAEDDISFEKSTEIHLYRIVQESINNAIKHGNASRIRIDCMRDRQSRTLTITDNGSGYHPLAEGRGTGMGLHIFQYRARLIDADINVQRGDDGGCIVTCVLPNSKPGRLAR